MACSWISCERNSSVPVVRKLNQVWKITYCHLFRRKLGKYQINCSGQEKQGKLKSFGIKVFITSKLSVKVRYIYVKPGSWDFVDKFIDRNMVTLLFASQKRNDTGRKKGTDRNAGRQD